MIRYGALIAAILLAFTGCMPKQLRLQNDDTDHDKENEIRTIGEISAVANADPIIVTGVGLVINLEGTGGNPASGTYRTLLEEQLRKKSVENVKGLLSSPNTSLVLVSAVIPAAARKHDKIDIEVTLPPGSKTTSLRGGYLTECALFNFNTAAGVNPDLAGKGDRFLKGHDLMLAEGPLLVGIRSGDDDPDAEPNLKIGRVWGGGNCLIDRSFYLTLNPDQQKSRIASQMADRINETFQGGRKFQDVVATASSKELVSLRVPPQYRHNLSRFLRAVRLVPLDGVAQTGCPYCKKLGEDLLDPAQTLTAALRLEALGAQGIDILTPALDSQYPLVRFATAEALAYLGRTNGVNELAKLVKEQPALQAFCLTALSALDETACHTKLQELLVATEPEVRYGAFRALRSLDEHDSLVLGEQLNGSYWLHRAAPESAGMIHVLGGQRAEIVLFGATPALQPPFALQAGTEYTVTASKGDDRCTVSRFSAQRGIKRQQCGLGLEEILHTLAELGGTYPDAVELLRQGDHFGSLTCAFHIDALPQASSVYALAKLGKENPNWAKTDETILKAGAELGGTPTLFERTSASKVPSKREG